MQKKYKFLLIEVFYHHNTGPIYEVIQDRNYDGED